MSTDPRRRVVLVAGSGRSGTSTIAGILKELGVHVPQPEVPADETNPKGFAEPQWLVDFHTRLLAKVGVQVSDARPAAWFDVVNGEVDEKMRAAATAWLEEQFAEADEVVLKDPRLIWCLGLWQGAAVRVGARASVVTMLRPPTEVVRSKQSHYGQRGESDLLAGWVNLMLHTERATRASTRAFVQYHDLLDDWTVPLSRLGETLGLESVKSASAAKINGAHQFVDPGLRRVEVGWDELDVPDSLRELASEAWDLLVEVGQCDDPHLHARFDDLRRRYADHYADAEAVAHSSVLAALAENERLRRRRDRLIERRSELQEKVRGLKETRAKLKGRNRRLRQRLREHEQRIAELEAALDRTTYNRIRRRLPTPVKQSAKRMIGRGGRDVGSI